MLRVISLYSYVFLYDYAIFALIFVSSWVLLNCAFLWSVRPFISVSFNRTEILNAMTALFIIYPMLIISTKVAEKDDELVVHKDED